MTRADAIAAVDHEDGVDMLGTAEADAFSAGGWASWFQCDAIRRRVE